MGHPSGRTPGRGVLGAVFAEARNRGMPVETLRNVIAPKILGKRISQATDVELRLLLDRLRKRNVPARLALTVFGTRFVTLRETVSVVTGSLPSMLSAGDLA